MFICILYILCLLFNVYIYICVLMYNMFIMYNAWYNSIYCEMYKGVKDKMWV